MPRGRLSATIETIQGGSDVRSAHYLFSRIRRSRYSVVHGRGWRRGNRADCPRSVQMTERPAAFSASPFDPIAGRPVVDRIKGCIYDLMDRDPGFAALQVRATDPWVSSLRQRQPVNRGLCSTFGGSAAGEGGRRLTQLTAHPTYAPAHCFRVRQGPILAADSPCQRSGPYGNGMFRPYGCECYGNA